MARRRGIALVLVNLMALFLLPFVIYLLVTSTAHLKTSAKERQLKMASGLASNVLVDFMRQFSQNYYSSHYDEDSLSRNPAFYSAGFSSVETEASAQDHRLFIHASGSYGKDPNSPLSGKDLYGVVQFISDLTDYGTLIDGAFNLSASDTVYQGKWWITGDLEISGDNVTFMGGPLIVGGNLRVTGSNVRINGDLYYEGTLTGSPVVSGTRYNFYPAEMIYPSIKDNYYKVNYGYKITADRTLKFNAYPSSSSFSLVGTTITVPVNEAGMVIYGENVNLSVYGTVKGRVTVATSNTSGGKGKITVGLANQVADLLYYDPLTGGTTTSAAYGSSFSAIASNGITFQGKTNNPTANLSACGVFFDRSAANMTATGASSRKMYLYGTRNKPVSTTFGGGSVYVYDVWLDKFPPPGLPERPVLVTWHLR